MKTTDKITVAALYQFINPREPEFYKWREPLYNFAKQLNIKGSLLIAPEGINGTIAGSLTAVRALKDFLLTNDIFKNLFTAELLEYKESYALNKPPFLRLKVKLKKEIVTLGVQDINPVQKKGTYIEPKDWNQLIDNPEVLVIDTRNSYETLVGKFKNALDPETENFRDFPEFVKNNLNNIPKDKKIAMYCTGGIRCEKSTSYLLSQGFENVYHLKGGILKYLEEIKEADSLWIGECFVFDERVTVKHNLELSNHTQCFACRYPLTPEQQKSDKYKPGISCDYCYATQTEKNRSRATERHKQINIAKKRGLSHLGAN